MTLGIAWDLQSLLFLHSTVRAPGTPTGLYVDMLKGSHPAEIFLIVKSARYEDLSSFPPRVLLRTSVCG